MNTDPHTKANIFYTVLSTLIIDTCKLNVEITGISKKITQHNGDEN